MFVAQLCLVLSKAQLHHDPIMSTFIQNSSHQFSHSISCINRAAFRLLECLILSLKHPTIQFNSFSITKTSSDPFILTGRYSVIKLHRSQDLYFSASNPVTWYPAAQTVKSKIHDHLPKGLLGHCFPSSSCSQKNRTTNVDFYLLMTHSWHWCSCCRNRWIQKYVWMIDLMLFCCDGCRHFTLTCYWNTTHLSM